VTHVQLVLYNQQTDSHHVLTVPSDTTLRLLHRLYVHHVNLVVSTISLLNCHVLLALLVLNNLLLVPLHVTLVPLVVLPLSLAL
jgi:hypothetical protein